MVVRKLLNLLVCLCVIASLVSPAAAASKKQKVAKPDDYALTMLIYTVMAGLHNAHVTGNYTVLRDLSAPQFRARNSAAKLGTIFAAHRKYGINIAAALLYPPRLDTAAYLDKNSLLQVRGSFETSPQRLVFSLTFQQVAGRWQIFGINVKLGKARAS